MVEKLYTDKSLQNDLAYQKFLKDNTGRGSLKIRASAANEAIPISGIKIKVSKVIGDNKIVFFQGETDYSGMINNIVLPAPPSIDNDEVAPNFTGYYVTATGSSQNVNQTFNISICCGITVIQYINVTPSAGAF